MNACAVVVLLACSAATADDVFRGLGVPPFNIIEPHSRARAISANGEWVAGGDILAYEPWHLYPIKASFVWSEGTGFALGFSTSMRRAVGVSDDGIALEYSGDSALQGIGRWQPPALPWLQPQMFTGVPISIWLDAIAISPDGQWTLGCYDTSCFRWKTTASTVFFDPAFRPRALSDDAGVVAGRLDAQAAAWRPGPGVVIVGGLPGGSGEGELVDVSGDGSTCVGWGVNAAGKEQPIRWRADQGVRGLAILAGSQSARAAGVSGDGSVIVGWAKDPDAPFIWDRVRGTRNLRSYLIQLGSTAVQSWTIEEIVGISADGTVILGNGTGPGGVRQPFLARVPAFCYANCDISLTPPVLNVADFSCFLQRFAAGDPYANCDDSTAGPVLNVADFGCFLQKFAAGCP